MSGISDTTGGAPHVKRVRIAVMTKSDEENEIVVDLVVISAFPCSLLIETPRRNFDLATLLPHIQLRLMATMNEGDGIGIFIGRAVSSSLEITSYDAVLHFTAESEYLNVSLPKNQNEIVFDITHNGGQFPLY